VSPVASAVADTASVSPGSSDLDLDLEFVRKFTARGEAPIWHSIQYLDHQALDILRRPAAPNADQLWQGYLERTKVSASTRRHDRDCDCARADRRAIGHGHGG
jgi:hypothetical protein